MEVPARGIGTAVEITGHTVAAVGYVVALPIKLISGRSDSEYVPGECSPEWGRCGHDPFRDGLRVYVTYLTDPPGGEILTAGNSAKAPVEFIYNYSYDPNSQVLAPAQPKGYSQDEKYVLAPATLYKQDDSPIRVVLPPVTAKWNQTRVTMTPVVDLVLCQRCQSVFPDNAVILKQASLKAESATREQTAAPDGRP